MENEHPAEHLESVEIERKFLVNDFNPEKINGAPYKLITQGYLVIGEDGAESRLRHTSEPLSDQYWLTVKTGKGQVRQEQEIELTQAQFDNLWPATDGKRIYKTRYFIPYRGYIIELDVYEFGLRGLVVAEVEFASETEAMRFLPPDWFGDDLTNEDAFKNRSLALNGRPQQNQ